MSEKETLNKKEAEKERLTQNFPCVEKDTSPQVTGVLLSDEIESYVKSCKLIYPFKKENLKPAAYKLTIGDEYSVGGEIRHLTDDPSDMIRIPAFQVAVIKTAETLNLPRFMIARWNIRVHMAYEGLLWVGGPQVDAGWVGHLFCPIYNLSSNEVTLRIGEGIATIDFVKTTPFTPGGKCVEYERPPDNVVFSDYRPDKLKSGLYVEAKERVDKVENKVEEIAGDTEKKVNTIGQRLDTSVSIMFAAIAVLVTAFAIFVSSDTVERVTVPWWFYLALAFSLISFVFSIFAYAQSRFLKNRGKKSDKVSKKINEKPQDDRV